MIFSAREVHLYAEPVELKALVVGQPYFRMTYFDEKTPHIETLVFLGEFERWDSLNKLHFLDVKTYYDGHRDKIITSLKNKNEVWENQDSRTPLYQRYSLCNIYSYLADEYEDDAIYNFDTVLNNMLHCGFIRQKTSHFMPAQVFIEDREICDYAEPISESDLVENEEYFQIDYIGDQKTLSFRTILYLGKHTEQNNKDYFYFIDAVIQSDLEEDVCLSDVIHDSEFVKIVLKLQVTQLDNIFNFNHALDEMIRYSAKQA